MAKAPAIRPTREIESFSGIGGYIEVTEPDVPGVIIQEIQQWEIWHRVRNVRLPMSGGFGAVGGRRVSSEFEFLAAADVDASAGSPFLEDTFEGPKEMEDRTFMFQAEFHLGDPTFYNKPLNSIARVAADRKGIYYRCNSILLKEVYTINSARGDDVVRCLVRGSGASPLRRYVNETWEGAGVYRIPQFLAPGKGQSQGHQRPDTGN